MFYNGQPTVQFFNLVTQIAMTGNSTNKLTSNIDGTEIAKFEAMAPIWWDKQGDFKALHDINVLRVNYINERVALTGKSLLDAGCGGGILSEAMASLGAVVTGIDMGEAALGVARLHLKESGLQVDYQQATTEQFAETHADRFDVVTCLELLEHVPDPASVLLPLTATSNLFCLRLSALNISSAWCAEAPTPMANLSNRRSLEVGPQIPD
jgi:ubiquinone biosynthesis O-methyltransferase